MFFYAVIRFCHVFSALKKLANIRRSKKNHNKYNFFGIKSITMPKFSPCKRNYSIRDKRGEETVIYIESNRKPGIAKHS